ncbi:MAG: cbb3-type cytochrome oxidase assembly protein [Anaerolineales bacterium]
MVFTGTWLVLATLGIILLMFGIAAYWAYSTGQFDDIEAAKYAMLKNDREYRDNEF